MTTTAQLNILDELYMHLDREDEPWSVHLEFEVEESVDPERLTEAVRQAAQVHPIARARLAGSKGTDFRYEWLIEEELADPPVSVVDAADDAALDRARE